MVRSFLCGRVHFGARAPLCLVPPFDLQSRRFGSEGSSKHELLHTLLIIVRFCPRSAPTPSPVLWSFEPQGPRSRVNDRHNTAAANKEREEKVQFAKPRGRTSVPLRDSRRILRSKEGEIGNIFGDDDERALLPPPPPPPLAHPHRHRVDVMRHVKTTSRGFIDEPSRTSDDFVVVIAYVVASSAATTP